YMPPEQLRGQVSFASDLYSLGATILFLLTKQCPDDLPQQRMKINFRSVVKISDKLTNWLNKILNPIAEERFQSVVEALKSLTSEHKFPKPENSSIVLDRTDDSLEIKIPLQGLDGKRFSKENIYLGLFTSGINILCGYLFFVCYVAFLEVARGIIPLAELAFIVFISPFWLALLAILGGFIFQNFGQIYIHIDKQRFKVSKRLLGFGILQKGETQAIRKIQGASSDYEVRGYNLVYCTVKGEKEVHFGVGITSKEREWLLAELQYFVEKYNKNLTNSIN
ncbi:MAG: hypothetical protein AAF383_30205, partial [Cyanobacteria bacterium P01_A01_bin.83]